MQCTASVCVAVLHCLGDLGNVVFCLFCRFSLGDFLECVICIVSYWGYLIAFKYLNIFLCVLVVLVMLSVIRQVIG